MVRRVRRRSASTDAALSGNAPGLGKTLRFSGEERVEISVRFPIGHYRAPIYVRGEFGEVVKVIEPPTNNDEGERVGRNAGSAQFTYRVATKLTAIWPAYAGRPLDALRLVVFETWVGRA